MGSTILGTIPRLEMSFLIQTTSFVALDATIYSVGTRVFHKSPIEF